MTPADVPALDRCLDVMSGAYAKKLSARELLAYRTVLSNEDIEAVEEAVHVLMRESRFLPRAGEIAAKAADIARKHEARAWASSATEGAATGEVCCVRCNDTGWAYVAFGRLCASMDDAERQRARHVRACPCRDTNSHYLYKRRADQARARSAS
jgi:hypothetical protein